jgi:hypothetical protein
MAFVQENLPRDSTNFGIRIDNSEQKAKHASSICAKLDSHSNVKDSACAFEKQDFNTTLTDRRTQIDVNQLLEKQNSPMICNPESGSNTNNSILFP